MDAYQCQVVTCYAGMSPACIVCLQQCKMMPLMKKYRGADTRKSSDWDTDADGCQHFKDCRYMHASIPNAKCSKPTISVTMPFPRGCHALALSMNSTSQQGNGTGSNTGGGSQQNQGGQQGGGQGGGQGPLGKVASTIRDAAQSVSQLVTGGGGGGAGGGGGGGGQLLQGVQMYPYISTNEASYRCACWVVNQRTRNMMLCLSQLIGSLRAICAVLLKNCSARPGYCGRYAARSKLGCKLVQHLAGSACTKQGSPAS